MKGLGKSVYWVLGGLLFFCLVYCHQKKFDSATPVARLDLLHALWEQHTVCIDAYHTNTPDKAVFNGHYYSDKAPGTVAVALPAFAVSTQILKLAKVPLESKTGWLVSSWIACAGSIALITALGGVALFAWLCHFVPPRPALVTVLALFLGAAPLPYSTMMFSHAMVVGLICIAIWALRLGLGSPTEKEGTEGINGCTRPPDGVAAGWHDEPATEPRDNQALAREPPSANQQSNPPSVSTSPPIRPSTNPPPPPRYGLAGFCCGLALASEFSSGLVMAGLLFWVLATDRHRALRFALAALGPLLLIPAYNWACFGHPLLLPYTFQASFPEMMHGIYAIQLPDANTAWNLLFPPTRGLLFWTPFLVMAAAGYWTVARKCAGLFLLTYLLPLLHLITISGRSWDWQAGHVLGPRLLSPLLPLLAMPCALGVQRWPCIGAAAAAYSIAITTLATLTNAVLSASIYNPLTAEHIPALLNGDLCPNLGTVFGLPSHPSTGVFYVVLASVVLGLGRQLSNRQDQPRQRK